MLILVINCGSSSVKYQLINTESGYRWPAGAWTGSECPAR